MTLIENTFTINDFYANVEKQFWIYWDGTDYDASKLSIEDKLNYLVERM